MMGAFSPTLPVLAPQPTNKRRTKQSSIYVADAMEGRLVVIESCAHIPMDEKSEVRAQSALQSNYSIKPTGAPLHVKFHSVFENVVG